MNYTNLEKSEQVFDLFLVVIYPCILLFGTVSNLINIIIFLKPKFEDPIYNYIIAHSIINFLYCIGCGTSMQMSSNHFVSFKITKSYLFQLYGFYIYNYLTSSMAMLNILIELIVSFQRLLILTNARLCRCVRNTSPFIILIVLTAFSLISYSQELIFFKVNIKANTTLNRYEISENKIGILYFKVYKYISISVSIFRGPICLILVILINTVSWFQFKKYMAKKSAMKGCNILVFKI
jgi:hypothetical protein